MCCPLWLILPEHICRYPSDDINKFLWMVRIGGGVFPDIKEKDYLANGQYRIDGEVTKAGSLTQLRVWRCLESSAWAAGP